MHQELSLPRAASACMHVWLYVCMQGVSRARNCLTRLRNSESAQNCVSQCKFAHAHTAMHYIHIAAYFLILVFLCELSSCSLHTPQETHIHMNTPACSLILVFLCELSSCSLGSAPEQCTTASRQGSSEAKLRMAPTAYRSACTLIASRHCMYVCTLVNYCLSARVV
jgi:hypothetical protein